MQEMECCRVGGLELLTVLRWARTTERERIYYCATGGQGRGSSGGAECNAILHRFDGTRPSISADTEFRLKLGCSSARSDAG